MKTSDQKVNVTLKTDDKGTATLLIGTANTPEVKELFEGVNFTGLIGAPAKFLLEKVAAKLVKKEKVLIIVDEVAETIILNSDFDNKFKHQVTGKLIRNSDIAELHINDGKRWGLKDLVSLLKFRRKLFSSTEEFNQLLNTLMTFNAKIEGDVKKENDLRGNISEAFIMKTKTNLKLDFTLEASIFKGGPVAKFKVDIYFEPVSLNSFQFYFESPDFHDLARDQAHHLIGEELEKLKDYTIVHK